MELTPVLKELQAFVYAEHEANTENLLEIWNKPLKEKLLKGETQRIESVTFVDSNHLEVVLGDNESRFREGDMICLHLGRPSDYKVFDQVTIEAENDGEWLLKVKVDQSLLPELSEGCYADPAGYDRTLIQCG